MAEEGITGSFITSGVIAVSRTSSIVPGTAISAGVS